jgi:hypothetical protein
LRGQAVLISTVERSAAEMQAKFGRQIGPGDTAVLASSADGAFRLLWIDYCRRSGRQQLRLAKASTEETALL